MNHVTARIDAAVAARFHVIRSTLRPYTSGYRYDGYRCKPTELGWRFRQYLSMRRREKDAGPTWQGYSGILERIADGSHDDDIESTWHEAAATQYWYENDKDWGHDEPAKEHDDDAEDNERREAEHCHDDGRRT